MHIPHPSPECLNDDTGELRSLSELLRSPSNELDAEMLPRVITDRVRELLDANLLGPKPTGDARIRAYTDVLKTLEAEYFIEDPFLLCWRVWWEDRPAALAPVDVRPPIPAAGTNSYKAMAARYDTHRRNNPKISRLYGSVLAEVR